MGSRLLSLSGVLVFVFTFNIFPSAGKSQPTQSSANETVSDVFNRAFFENGPEFFRNRSIGRQLNLIFGPGILIRSSFPEAEIRRDARLVDLLYQDVLQQQVSSDPVIRTPDLPNPYQSTILTSPGNNSGSRLRELLFEKPPQ